jgi:hypothetical protein
MLNNKEVKSIMEEDVRIQMQYNRPKKGFNHRTGESFDVWDASTRVEYTKQTEERCFVVYGYKVIPVRTFVAARTGSEANIIAAKQPEEEWFEIESGYKPLFDVRWKKGINPNDNEEKVIQECDELHIKKLKGNGYTYYHQTQNNKRHRTRAA